jgi:hypothetical protein
VNGEGVSLGERCVRGVWLVVWFLLLVDARVDRLGGGL